MQAALEKAIFSYWKRVGIKCFFDAENHVLYPQFDIASVINRFVFEMSFRDNGILTSVVLPFAAPESFRASISELICRINHSLICRTGYSYERFEIDLADGEISYSMFYPCTSVPDFDQTEEIFWTPLFTIEKYLPAFARVFFSGETACEAFGQDECSQHYSEQKHLARQKRSCAAKLTSVPKLSE